MVDLQTISAHLRRFQFVSLRTANIIELKNISDKPSISKGQLRSHKGIFRLKKKKKLAKICGFQEKKSKKRTESKKIYNTKDIAEAKRRLGAVTLKCLHFLSNVSST